MFKDIKYFVISGEPGVGKTTLTKKLCTLMADKGIKTTGFITEEVREGRVRQGFDVVTLDGVRSRLARDQALMPAPVKFTVGKYGVLVNEFEKAALPSLGKLDIGPACYVIDEIGKMEFFSSLFKSRIKEIFSTNNFVLATIPIRKSDSLIESIRNHVNTKLWIVTRENRNTVHQEILRVILTSMKIEEK